MRRVVVTGLGMLSPVGNNVSDSWNAAVAGKSGIAPITSFDASRLPVHFAGEVKGFDPLPLVDAKDQKRSTRFIQFAVVAAGEALEDAGLLENADFSRIGSSVGVGIGAIQDIYEAAQVLSHKGPRRITPYFIPMVISNMASGWVANSFGLQGPNVCTTTACTSGTHAVGEAFMYIRSGMADAMVCGGSEAAISEIAMAGFANMKALSRRNHDPATASRPFDKDRDGFVFGEGAGLLVLEEYENAKKRGAKIYAEVTGYGMSGDAHHITQPAPRGRGAAACMRAALQTSGINLEELDYVNAHGTSTPANDLCETQALHDVFGAHASRLMISSTKGVTGHCLGAAGGIEAVFLAKTIETQTVPPTANLLEPGEGCDLDYVPDTARQAQVNVGLSNSFGFGGTNASLVFQKI